MFKNSAYIGKVTEDLIELLESLGYHNSSTERFCDWENSKDYGIATAGSQGSYTIIHRTSWETTNPHRTWNTAGRINCGIDEVRFYDVIKEKFEI